MSDPPYWRRRPEPTPLERLGAERRLLLTAGPHSVVVRPVLTGGRLLLLADRHPEVESHLDAGRPTTLTPCDSRGEPRPDRPFDVADPVRTSRPAEPVAVRVRPSPGDATTAVVLDATRHRLAGGMRSAVRTVRGLVGSPAAPPLVLEAWLDGS